MKHLSLSRGNALVGTLLASAIGAMALVYLGQAITGAARASQLLRETVVAEAYGAELLEYFISQRPNRLKEYLSSFPYALCIPINEVYPPVLPSLVPTIEHPDPLAAMEQPSLREAIRTYQVFVVDISRPLDPDNLPILWNLCASPFTAASVILGPTERYWIKVEVSWRSTSGISRSTQMSSIVGGT